ncbi:choice-of-anchor D domain-containing protein [Micromonospora sp. ATA32]|nr:choice-of-anchor D domain-containing protein [Micromonospora sp. ATA32]
MRTFRTLLGVGIAGACALPGLPGVALAAPTAPYTVLTVDAGDHGGGYPLDKSGVYDSSTSTVTFTPFADDRVNLETNTAGSYVRLDFNPPSGQSFVAGQTYQATGYGDGGTARLDIASDGRGCGGSTGSISVKQIDRDAGTGLITAFAAAYQYSCTSIRNDGLITGEIRWKSDVDYVVAHGDPTPVSFGYQEIAVRGAARTVTFRSVGSKPITFGAASLAGATPGAFTLLSSNCSGQTVAPGGSCTVTVAANPTKSAVQTASLLLADNSSAGTRRVGLSVEGFRGVTGTYYPVSPARLLDTRTGLGAPKAKIGAQRKVDLQVAGRGGVPASGVGSVVLNVTVTGPTAGSFLTLYPAGQSQPNASSINFPKSWLGSNNVTVKLGASGKVSVYNHSGSTDVVVDVVGFYAANNTLASRGMGGQYQWFKPFRLFDTRTDGGGPLPAGYYTQGWVDFGQYNSNIRALVLNITAVSPTRGGFLSAWSGVGGVPTSSTVNYGAGKIVPNLAFVQTNPCSQDCGDGYGAPEFAIYSSQTTHLVVDVVGLIDDGNIPDGLRFTPQSPTRITDSRIGQGLPTALGHGSVGKVTAPSSLVTSSTEVLSMNVTAVSPTANTVLTVWPADFGMSKPGVSNLNPAPGQTVSNAVMGVIGPNDAFNVHNLAGTTHVVADVVGTLWLYPDTATSPTVAAAAKANAERLKVVDSGRQAPVRG